MSMTRADIRAYVRDFLEDSTATVTSPLYSNTELNRYISHAEEFYFQDIINASEDFFLVRYTVSVGPSTETGGYQIYKLPTDCERIRLIESVTSPGTYYTSISLKHKPGYDNAVSANQIYLNTNSAAGENHWVIVGDNIQFIPKFSSNVTLMMWYDQRQTLMSSDSDYPWGGHDNLKSHHNVIAIRAAKLAKIAKEAEYVSLDSVEREERRRLLSAVEERDETQTRCVQIDRWD